MVVPQGSVGKLPGRGAHGAVFLFTMAPSVRKCASLSPSSPASGENVAADGNVDLSKLEVSLTLTNKFEGLETDADDTNAQSLLLRWASSLGPLSLPRPVRWLLWSGHPSFFLGSLILHRVLPEADWPSPCCGLSCFPSGGLSFLRCLVAEGKG